MIHNNIVSHNMLIGIVNSNICLPPTSATNYSKHTWVRHETTHYKPVQFHGDKHLSEVILCLRM